MATDPARLRQMKVLRDKLIEEGLCINARSHGKATHGQRCYRCSIKHANKGRQRRGVELLAVPENTNAYSREMSYEGLIRQMASYIKIRPFRADVACTYEPDIASALDEWSTRALRRLRFFGYVSQIDLRDAVEAETEADRNALSASLSRMTRDGYVEREWRTHRWYNADNGYWYRITQAGRDELKRRLNRINRLPVATDEEIAAHDAELAQYGRKAA